jgi:TolB-like protein/DNA-binding winged helix-turn-helix (wHTH) protein/Flp pilus assembly protein TadD
MEDSKFSPIVRFGVYEADLAAGELRKNGLKVKLQGKPFEIMAILLEHAGEVVSRDQLHKRLWPVDTFVDFDHGLNNAMNKLRFALGDSADNSRFILTVGGRGYRFIAPVERNGPELASPVALPEVPLPAGPAAREERKTRPKRLWLTVAVVGLAVVMAAGAGWRFQHKSIPISIAVLPLENLGHDPANDYFADGLTDELIRSLSAIEGLAVRSRTSSFAMKGKPRNVLESGQYLQADYILEGSVLRAGQEVRINTQLVRVRDDFPMWSGKFDRELTHVIAIQDEISLGIVNSLRLKLGQGRRRYETSVEAYDLYLRARELDLVQSIGVFQEAIAKDPSFAPAYAGLAQVYAFRSDGPAFDRPDELAKMRAAAEKAIQLDPLLAEAHEALGLAYAREGQWEQSEKSFRRAIELNPGRSESYYYFARNLLLVLGRIEEALQQLHIAEKVDPLAPEVQFDLAYVLLSAGRYDEAASHCPKLPQDSLLRTQCVGRTLLGQGRTGEAIQVLATAVNRGVVPDNTPVQGYLGYAYGRAGRREEAEKLAAAVALNPFLQTLIFAGLGDKDRTFEALGRMATLLGPVRVGRALTLPELALLRGDPRLKALRKKVGLPE